MKIKFLTLLLFCFTIGNSQVTNLLSGLNNGITNLVVFENNIYFSSFSNKTIYKYPVTGNSSQSPEVFRVLTSNPTQLLLHNNDLFIATEQTSHIYKINLLATDTTPIEVTDIYGPMVIKNNFLYVGQYVDSKIVKINLSNGIKTDYLTGYKPNYFNLQGDDLYFTSNTTNKLYKINLINNSLNIILQNLNYVSGIVIENNICYLCESQADKISYYDLNSNQFVNFVSLTSSSWPNGITIYNDTIYFISTVGGQVSSIPISTLGIPTNQKKTYTIYPNPTTELLNILTDEILEEFQIFDTTGKEVLKGKFETNHINVTQLQAGAYILKIKNSITRFEKN
ncbi:T9SS type A sorting domain-containing protein [Flavobacterium facile]|jgi:hypothetical protein|uniref:T9SS type A sorting domain-containing protein n=1 Tax=Flavobacterium facile TaxID=2893174 RepID=UPI002E75B931|nr:T9SS type A sorting domain-containing protein [Flavobacterium sp. T-12]